MPLNSAQQFPLMAITQDGLSLSHSEQTEQLCAAGVRWVQLRMKKAEPNHWLTTARAFVAICQDYQAISIINDSVDIALETGADGVHLGKLDLDWITARQRLGPDHLIGGTGNNAEDADRARQAQCLAYVGLGPLRFTQHKENLAPILAFDGVVASAKRLTGRPP